MKISQFMPCLGYSKAQQYLAQLEFLIISCIEMLSHSIINEVRQYDVVYIGNFAAIVADHISSTQTHKYKFALLHFEHQIKQNYQSSIGFNTISVNGKPQGVDIIQKRIQQISPHQKAIFLEDGEKIVYKFLVYGQNEWTAHQKEHPLAEAMQCQYSRVYSDRVEFNRQLFQSQGKIIFYVPKGPGSFRHNYPFFKVLQKVRNKRSTQLCIFLEGNSFFPYCQKAHELLEQRLNQQNIKIFYQVKIKHVDFLRRVLFYEKGEERLQVPYESIYCFIDEQTPKLLADAGIDPYNCCHRLLHNCVYDNIYLIGANYLPTTQSFYSLSMQVHHIAQNLYERVDAQQSQRKAILSVYDGSTSFYLQLGIKDIVQVKHKYKGKNYKVKQVPCWNRLIDCWRDFLVKQFFNFDSYGPPHYMWEPSLTPSVKWQDESGQAEREQLWRLSQLTLHLNNKPSKST